MNEINTHQEDINSEIIEGVEQSQDDVLATLVGRKFTQAWSLVRSELGNANVHKTAEYFYHSLYNPNFFTEHGLTTDYPDKTSWVATTLPRQQETPPPIDEFIEDIKHTLWREVDHQAALYEDAIPVLKTMMLRGHVTMWTSGDHDSVSEQSIPGSAFQIKKMIAVGIGDARREVAREHEPRLNPHDVLSAVASDDKFIELPDILNEYRLRGVDEVVVIEDQVKNLLKTEEIAKEKGVKIFPVWVQQGQHGQKRPEGVDEQDIATKFHAIENIQQLNHIIEALNPDSKIEFLVDFDGIIVDDEKRYELQEKAIYAHLRMKGWI